ncbi:prephenate dehydrogenase [Mycolicibacterium arenosum]|uniref:Prephenate dehydrogenase n=1 Tax=Mycolicibacterium arenosum TaxID=2952157 RepID=A0ABT1M9S3_9MYCO|nr:prephenate dehydrogenase [Mycolicibacterium sp. CAU 1645]MCP9275878.1 prephenate dehydrogenase [Mycolicibacterium sp. CAU 1645]
MCVLGLGLIGGSVMRALTATGREVFGYNRSIDGVQAARFDGFNATDSITEVLTRAAASDALIVLAVPVPALPIMLDHIRTTAPGCALTDVVSVKGALLRLVTDYGLLDRYVGGHPMAGTAHSGWSAGSPDLFVGAPWVVSVDDHVDADVWTDVMHLALDCRAVVVPARAHEHDAAVAAISHLPHLLAEALAATAFDVPLAFALAAGSFRDGTRVAATSPDLVRAMCEANSEQLQVMLNRAIYRLEQARNGLSAHASVADLVESGHAARVSYDSLVRPDIVTVAVGEDNWRAELAAQGRAGGVIRSALPVRGSRG